MSRGLRVCLAALALNVHCPAASKEIVELQREMALLGQRVRMMEQSMNEKLGGLNVLLKQTLDRVNDVHTLDVLTQKTLADRLAEIEKRVTVPVTGLQTKMDQSNADVRFVRESVADLAARIQHLEQKLVDIDTALRVLQAPAPPPPSASAALGGPPAGVSAESLFQAAVRDKLAGNTELALKEFQDYLRYFGNTELAASSQYHIGEIHYDKGELDDALAAFDAVLEAYPKSGKAPDALLMMALTHRKQGQQTKATSELRALVRDYPGSDAAQRAKLELSRPSRRSKK